MRTPLLKITAMLSAIGLLASCSSMSDITPGTPLAQVIQSFGSPHTQCVDDGQRLATWTTQPMGQYAWTAELDDNETVIAMRQMLSDAEFTRLNDGYWPPERVQCWFGPPADREIVPLRGVPMNTWSYRYRQGGAFNGMLTIYFNDNNEVVHYHSGPDPIELRDGMFPFLN